MNHSSKISLVLLLIPIYNYCSHAEQKSTHKTTSRSSLSDNMSNSNVTVVHNNENKI